MYVRWLTAFFDFPADEFGTEVTFWRAISGSTVSPPRGDAMEFATLEPFNGAPYLRVQRIEDGPGGMHLDLHVDDPHAAADHAVALGAALVADHGADAHVTLRSPAGGVFCLVPSRADDTAKARPIRWPGGGISIIDQLWFDVPADTFDTEVAFWAELTGQESPPTDGLDEVALTRRPRLSLQVVIRRTAVDTPIVLLAVAATNVPDEVDRHEDWGATVVTSGDQTVEMADPIGRRYFITKRNPRTGV
ncbi:VOC family protein [Gordonia shandongensis]|uniref:VOC family protein n=1 Tax=Gordonia shandongensis TaxID=376351 RepID=UPI000420E0C6|nr:VOC family protein [Gordonia shandongensis]